MDKDIKVFGFRLNAREYETDYSERSFYGTAVYIISRIPCELWDRMMPSGTIRDKSRRDVNDLWGAFIYNDISNLNSFISELSNDCGYRIHLANKSTVPPSVYNYLTSRGKNWYGDGPDSSISLIFYASNK